MARSILIRLPLTLGLLAAGITGSLACNEAPALVVDAPLFVFNTYPGNGVTLARDDLGEIAVTFSADLGEPDEVRAVIADFVLFEDETGPIRLVKPDAINVAWDTDEWTLRFVIDENIRETLGEGRYRLTIYAGLTAADGRVLPTDHLVRFRVVP